MNTIEAIIQLTARDLTCKLVGVCNGLVRLYRSCFATADNEFCQCMIAVPLLAIRFFLSWKRFPDNLRCMSVTALEIISGWRVLAMRLELSRYAFAKLAILFPLLRCERHCDVCNGDTKSRDRFTWQYGKHLCSLAGVVFKTKERNALGEAISILAVRPAATI